MGLVFFGAQAPDSLALLKEGQLTELVAAPVPDIQTAYVDDLGRASLLVREEESTNTLTLLTQRVGQKPRRIRLKQLLSPTTTKLEAAQTQLIGHTLLTHEGPTSSLVTVDTNLDAIATRIAPGRYFCRAGDYRVFGSKSTLTFISGDTARTIDRPEPLPLRYARSYSWTDEWGTSPPLPTEEARAKCSASGVIQLDEATVCTIDGCRRLDRFASDTVGPSLDRAGDRWVYAWRDVGRNGLVLHIADPTQESPGRDVIIPSAYGESFVVPDPSAERTRLSEFELFGGPEQALLFAEVKGEVIGLRLSPDGTVGPVEIEWQ